MWKENKIELGDKILELRKKKNLSQENLAEKLNVTRQTISKWELGETAPDIKQAKELSKIFDISLDELVGNKKRDIQYEKIIKIEDNSNMILKMIKVTGITIGILLFFILVIIASILFFSNYFQAEPSGSGIGTYCEINGTTIYYEVMENYNTKELTFNTTDIETKKKFNTANYTRPEDMIKDVENYIESIGGKCRIDVNEIEEYSNTNN